MQPSILNYIQDIRDFLHVVVYEDVCLILLVFAEVEKFGDQTIGGLHPRKVVFVVNIVHGTKGGHCIMRTDRG